MRKIYFFLLIPVLFFVSLGLYSLPETEGEDGSSDIGYRRSSLHLVLIDSGEFPKKEAVVNSYNKYPFPDKYNNHTIANLKTFILNEGTSAGVAAMPTDSSAKAAGDEKEAMMPVKINKYIQDVKLANQLVAKWFNRDSNGAFDLDLVQERGMYDASATDASIAKGSVKGEAMLKDAGEELIPNTFVVFSQLNFVENEPFARIIRDESISAAQKLPMGSAAVVAAANLLYNKTKDGYSVWTTSWLYKLQWNDSVASIFWNDYYMDKSNVNLAKKNAFDNTDLFKMEFVGQQKSNSLILLGKNRSEEEIIELATIRNMDATMAKLQKKYDVFKPSVPLLSSDPLTAQIGMKEGLEGGEKFAVLQPTLDAKTGKIVYNKIGEITVDKNAVWDNRFNASEENLVALGDSAISSPAINLTSFKGGSKKIQSGMLIKQIK